MWLQSPIWGNTKKDKADDFKLEEILKRANQHFKNNLRSSELAINYLKKRGLTGAVAREFQIGFASDDWQGLKKEFVNYVIQINGKTRSVVNEKINLSKEDLIELVKNNQKTKIYLQQTMSIKKVIFIPNKLINIII